MANPVLTPRTLRAAAKRRLASSSVAHVHRASAQYAGSLRPREARFSRAESAVCSDGDR